MKHRDSYIACPCAVHRDARRARPAAANTYYARYVDGNLYEIGNDAQVEQECRSRFN